MNKPEDIYNKKYVNKIVDKDWRYQEIPKQIKIMMDFFNPKSVLDIGAANGLHTKAFKEMGCKTFGIEGTRHFEPYLKDNSDEYLIYDLREPLDLNRKFDLVHSAEVLEHIEEKFVDVILDTMCRHSDTLFITANPTKGGVAHVNPQPKTYWIAKFKEHGFEYQTEETDIISKKFRNIARAGWYVVYSGVYRRV